MLGANKQLRESLARTASEDRVPRQMGGHMSRCFVKVFMLPLLSVLNFHLRRQVVSRGVSETERDGCPVQTAYADTHYARSFQTGIPYSSEPQSLDKQ